MSKINIFTDFCQAQPQFNWIQFNLIEDELVLILPQTVEIVQPPTHQQSTDTSRILQDYGKWQGCFKIISK